MLLQTAADASSVSTLNAVIFGVVEGITEFLPISSTAHLILTARALHLEETEYLKSFQIIIQFGAILSVVVLYWNKFWNVEVLKKLVVAFVPTGILGFALHTVIKSYLGDMAVVLTTLLVGGIALIVFERWKRADKEEIDFSEITYQRAVLI